MPKNVKISTKQAIILIVVIILPTSFITMPSLLINISRQDALISVLLASLAGIFIAWIISALFVRFPRNNLFEVTEKVFGKVIGKTINLLYVVWFLHTNILIIKQFSYAINLTILVNTPIIIFYIMPILISIYAIYKGFEVIARVSELFIPVILAFMLMIFILNAGNMDINNLFPLFDTDFSAILKATAIGVSWIGEIILFSMFIPYLSKPENVKLIGISAMLVILFFLSLAVSGTLMVLTPYAAGNFVLPVFNSLRLISIGNFLERLESVIIVSWIFTQFGKICIFYYAAVLGSAQLLGLKNYKPLIIPIGILLFILAVFLFPNIIEVMNFILVFFPPYEMPFFEIGIPLLLLITAVITKKGNKKNDA